MGTRQRWAIWIVLAQLAGQSEATVLERADWAAFRESFAGGVDHADLVTLQENVVFDGGHAIFVEAAQLVMADPQLAQFAGGWQRYTQFGAIQIDVFDDAEALSDWEIVFEGPCIPSRLDSTRGTFRISASGNLLSFEFTAGETSSQVSLARSSEWFSLNVGSYGGPSFLRAGETQNLWELQSVFFYPDRIEFRGGGFRVDELVLTPWIAVGTEEKSWGGVKGLYKDR
jgi:hypothetical protein